MGEFHVDGWKSDWRKAMEADFAARGVSGDSRPVKQARPKAVLVRKTPAPPVKGRTKSEYMRDRRAKAINEGRCVDCQNVPAKKGNTCCVTCQAKRTAREVKRNQAKKAA
jgi:hypothetical protein